MSISSPLDGMLFHRRVSLLGFKFASMHLYNWVERRNVRAKLCVAQEHSTMTLLELEAQTLDLECDASTIKP